VTPDTPRLRLGIVGVVVLSLFVALFSRLWFLQVLSSDEYELAAQVNAVRVVHQPAPRGRILDRDGVVIVDNRASNVVAVDRTALADEDRPALLQRLSEVLFESVEVLEARLDDQRVSRLVPVPMATDVPNDVMAHLRERQADHPAVVLRREAVRAYPHGTLAAHVLGYVGEINDRELEEAEGEYRLGDRIGKSGIERVYEADLRGRDGETRIEVDALGRPVRVVGERPPVQGDDVVLSISLAAQREAEAALAEGLEAARARQASSGGGENLVADAGAIVALDAREGTVAAMASWPTFDPRELVDRITPEQAEFLFGDASGAPFTNRATQGVYAPGSTWKLVTGAAGLQSGVITPDTVVNDTGVWRIPTCTRGCQRFNSGRASFGPVNVRSAMAVSSNIFFYQIGAALWERRGELGDEVLQQEARRLGFGEPTGVEIGSELAGRIPTPESRARLHEENPDAFPEGQWFIGDNVNFSIGQGEMGTTPVQLANAYATFSTGTRFAPNLVLRVERVVDGERQVVREVAPRVVEQVHYDPSVHLPIMEGLRAVATHDKGTARTSFAGWPHEMYPVAAKTGTGQARPKQDTALFAALAPAHDPHYVISVVMEQAGFGGTAAAPAARRVLGVLSGVEVPVPAPPPEPPPVVDGVPPELVPEAPPAGVPVDAPLDGPPADGPPPPGDPLLAVGD
jgi:penicillin-binding protein 2